MERRGKPIPARKRIPIITDLIEIPQMISNPIGYCQRIVNKYGDVCYVPIPGARQNYFIHDPEIIKEILVTQSGKFKKSRLYRAMKRFLGEGLLTSDGMYHLQQRRLATPAFLRQRVHQYAETMVQCTLDEIRHWKEGDTVNITQAMTNITLQIVTNTLFGSEMKAEIREKVSKDVGRLLELTARIFQNPLYLMCFEKDIKIPITRKFYRVKEEVDQTILNIINSYKPMPDSGQQDLLSMLMLAKDEITGATMSAEQLRDEVMTMFLAGHETTAVGLNWLWYTLGKHPKEEELFYKEISKVIGNRTPTADDYPSLIYTRNVFKEALRLYPPVWTLAREATEDVEIKGYYFPKGSALGWLTYILHRNSAYFENPDTFDPSRWEGDQLKDLPRFAYAPFGGGNRMCIGEGFTWMEAILIMATIASRFRLQLPKDFTTSVYAVFTLRAKDTIQMNVQKQNNQ